MSDLVPGMRPPSPAATAAWRELRQALTGAEPCRRDSNLWTADDQFSRTLAVGACLDCQALAACRDYASVAGEQHGVWGGVDFSRRRHPGSPPKGRTAMTTLHDLPPDPDRDDVPPELLAHEGQVVISIAADGTEETAVLVVAPGLFGHARRLREGQSGD